MSLCSCSGSIPEQTSSFSGSIPGQTSQTPVSLYVPVLALYPDRPVRPLYVCVFLFWFYTRTDQSESCMSVCSYFGSVPGQTSQTPVCLCVLILVLYPDRPVRPLYVCVFLFWFYTQTDQSDSCMSVCSCSGSIPGYPSQTPVRLYVPVLVLYPDRPVSLLYVCGFLFWFHTQTDQSDPCMSVCSCSGSIAG